MNDRSKTTADTSRVLDEISRSNVASTPQRGSRAWLWMAFILLLLAPSAAGISWLVLQQAELTQSVVSLEQENHRLSLTLDGLDGLDGLDESPEQFTRLQQHLEQQITDQLSQQQAVIQTLSDESGIERLRSQVTRDIEQLNRQVSAMQRQLAALQNRDVHLQYTEVEHLLRLADRKLRLEVDVPSALVLMHDADKILEQIDSTMSNTLRLHLAENVDALRALDLPDISSLHNRLQTLIDSAATLSIRDSLRTAYMQQGSGSTQESSGSTQQGTGNIVWDTLRGIFVVREWQQPAATRFSPQYEAMVKHSLRLQLEQAQLALVLRDTALFTSAIAQARTTLNENFAIDAADVAGLDDQLERLGAIDLRPPLPDMENTLTTARQLSGVQGN